MHYLFLPLDQHFDSGFGAVADSFKDSADALASANIAVTHVHASLPISFLYRHAIELYLKSAALIFHRKLQLPYGDTPFDGEPKIFNRGNWFPMYRVHQISVLYKNFQRLFSSQQNYLAAETNTDWSFPPELDKWIAEIDDTDPSSTFFRYPVTRDPKKDKDKSVIGESNYDQMLKTAAEGQKRLKAFLLVDQNDEVSQSFSHDDTLANVTIATLQRTCQVLHDCHAALIGELTGGW
jgi:hypothetical protein